MQNQYFENVIFGVSDHRYLLTFLTCNARSKTRVCFEHNEVFGPTFTLLVANGSFIEGSDDDHPFELDGIKKAPSEYF